MKKTLIVLALAAALVLMFASVAMARPNGNIYISWSSAAPNDVVPTPHAGYTSATEKCNVCHSVHYAATANFTWPDTAGGGANAWTSDDTDTEMLLRSSVANACNYCHIETAIGGIQLYGGVVTNYTVGSTFAHNGPSAACSGCHAVHGANTFQGANLNKILRVRADRPIQPEVIGAAGGNPAIAPVFGSQAAAVASGNKYLQQIAFCTQCHAEYTDASESTITGGPGYYDNGSYIAGSEYKGHPLKGFDANFSAKGANFTGQAAFVTAATCRDCHDAGNVDEAGSGVGVTLNNYPHYTQGYFVFSRFGAFAGSFDASDSARTSATDGNCLKCHVDNTNTLGVGKTF